ncbi:MAG: WD40 repeat domain-containing protein [Arachnia propionica]|uniref:WD40 repeat domain-containing protein n=1 Tax=Arachnia propionica TaxID=1750 RepID=UPI002706F2FE|nr:WD40 repeat domain-containing protein [Arachnia propionica]
MNLVDPVARWSPDGSRFALSTDLDGVEVLDWSPDSSRLVTGGDGTAAHVRDAAGRIILTLDGHVEGIQEVAWSPGSDLLLTRDDNDTVRLWDTTEGALRLTLQATMSETFTWHPDGTRFLGTAPGGPVTVWDLSGTPLLKLQPPPPGHASSIEAFAWHPDGDRIATTGAFDPIFIWGRDGELLHQLPPIHGWRVPLAWRGDGALAAGSSGRAVVWDIATATLLNTTDVPGEVLALAWSPDQERLAIATTTVLATWRPGETLSHLREDLDLSHWPEVALTWQDDTTPTLAPGDNDTPALSPDGSRTAVPSRSAWHDGELEIRDAATGDVLATTPCRPGYAPIARWSPDGTMLAHTTFGPEARIHTLATATTTVLAGHIDEVVDLCWSPDSRQLATGSIDNRARIWDATTGRCVLVLHEHDQCVDEVRWRPHGDLIASRDLNNEILIWNPTTGRVHTRITPALEIISLTWHPDGTKLLGMTEDGTIVWDVVTAR